MPTGEQDGEADFARLIEPHFDRLYRLAYRLTGAKANAEDLLQDVLTRLYEQRAGLARIEDLKPWLSRVLYNRFVDTDRGAKRRPLTLVGDVTELEAGLTTDEADPAALTAAAQNARRLEQSLGRLSEDQRALLLMHDAEGYTLREIEAMTGTPSGTLKSRLSRARARLRELLWDLPEAQQASRQTVADGATADGTKKKMEPFSRDRRVGG